MKYLILYDLVDKFNVLVLKELNDEFYINSDGKKYSKDDIRSKLEDGWHYAKEIFESDFHREVERRIKLAERRIDSYNKDIIRLTQLLKKEG